MDGSDKNGCGRKCYHEYNNNRTIGRSDLSQICNMKLMDAQRTIENKDILIKMLQDQLKKMEGMYKKNLSECEQIRYNYCLASDQLIQMQEEKPTKIPCRHADQVEVALQEEMLKLANQQSSSTTEWIEIKERLDELGKMVMDKHEELNDKIERIAGQRCLKITHKTVIPGMKHHAELKEEAVQVGQVADKFLEPARTADEVQAANLDPNFQPNGVCVIQSFTTTQSSNCLGSYADDILLLEQVRMARHSVSQKFVPEYRVGLESEIVTPEVNPKQASSASPDEDFRPNAEGAAHSFGTIQSSSYSGSFVDDKILMDQIRIARESLSHKADPECGIGAASQQVEENDEPEQSVMEILAETQEESRKHRVSIDNRELFRRLTEEDRRSSLSSGGAGAPKKRSVIFQGVPKESSSVEVSSSDLSKVKVLPEVYPELVNCDVQPIVVEFRQLQEDVYQIKSAVHKLEAANRSCERQIGKLNHVLSNHSQSTLFKFEEHKGLTQELLKENLIVHNELRRVKQFVERLRRRSSEATSEYRSGDPLISDPDSLDSDVTVDKVFCKISKLFDQKHVEQVHENSSIQISSDNVALTSTSSGSVGFTTTDPNASSTEKITIHRQIEQIRKRSSVGQRAGFAEHTKGVESKRLSTDLESLNESEGENQKELEEKCEHELAEQQDEKNTGDDSEINQIDTNSKCNSNTFKSRTTSSDSFRNLTNNIDSSPSPPDTYSRENNVDSPSTSPVCQLQNTEESKNAPSLSSAELRDGGSQTASQSHLPDYQNESSPTATTPDEEYLQYYIGKVMEENGKLETTINDLLENVRGKIDELNQDKANAECESSELGKSDQYTQISDQNADEEQKTVVVPPDDDNISKCSYALKLEQAVSEVRPEPAVPDCASFEVVLSKFSRENCSNDEEKQKRILLNTLENYSLYLQEQLLVTKKIENDVQNLKGTVTSNNDMFRTSFAKYKTGL